MKLIAYDFDGTVYKGDSSVDFYKYCFKKNKKIIKYWPKQIWYAFLYIVGIKTKTEMKQTFFSFLKDIDTQKMVTSFWKEHEENLKGWYLQKKHQKDIIISASPEFLLEPVCKKIGVQELIASKVDCKTGKFLTENCFGEEKVNRLREWNKDIVISEMYTDSTSDEPMVKLAKQGYMVIKDTIIPYDQYQPPMIKKIKKTFGNPQFFRFIFVGGLNTCNGIFLAYLFSLIIENATIAFMAGYLASLVACYFLNSYITFHDKQLSFKKFIQLCISYIPNFLIQTISVWIFIDILHFHKLVAYIVAAIVGIPITYLALLILPFKKK